ncbi:polyamine aminopropyltransferase [Candidatus Erwinia haradaeae]|uniref:Polyamine aminopropyltransferase n=1 Tax=Candidatus Erwinia haradaeae TaxID=1922217 RepID=A0A451D8N1_9GAMM|nr:polyamine aminopropyltransferase [Candidatus Erwinia haradaeae]VFP82135.1 Polyamine aminopropyltransferase [Candidatus Erwinia haradaeae]
MLTNNLWHETLHSKLGQYFTINKILHRTRTNHQNLIIFENTNVGRILALDGIVQTTESDEFIYHEMMAHVPLLAHGNARKVLIIGGGDGAMLREISYHKNIEQITMVEIDASVIELCKRYLPNHHSGSFENPLCQLVIDNGVHFVQTTSDRFDVIISDSPDPIGPGESLYTSKFYEGCHKCLNPGGILVTQSGVCFFQLNEAINSYRKLQNYFNDVKFYQASIPTYYGGIMTFSWSSNNPVLRQIDVSTLIHRYNKTNLKCRYYNPKLHASSFALPQYFLDALKDSSAF